MKPITVILIATFFSLIIARAIWMNRRHRITVMRINSERDEVEYEGNSYDEFIASAKEVSGDTAKEECQEVFRVIGENIDPETPDQAMIFDEANNVVLISAAIMARIYAGDMALKKRVLDFVGQYPDSKVLVGNFGIKVVEE